MASRKKSGPKSKAAAGRRFAGPWSVRRLLVWTGRGCLAAIACLLLLILLFTVVNPPITPYILSESLRLGGVERRWVPIEDMAPDLPRSVVAAEDANFCLHWGFDMAAIRGALDSGAGRGASTLSQQVVKNVFLWQGRSWPRKALEALITPVVELVWTKRRILEVYLNVAETGLGRFGVDAVSRAAFDLPPSGLSAVQSARIAAVLPDPKARSAAKPGPRMRRRADGIVDGAATIAADGRAACFED